MDDGDLLRAWREGDRAAGAALVERYYDPITRFFRTKAGAHADDLVQRAFLALSESRDRYRGASSFRAFLFGIARNVLLEHLRGRAREKQVDPDFGVTSILDLAPGVSSMVEQKAEQRLLIACLQRLPVDLQVALELCYWEGLGIEELAHALGIPPGTVKSRLFRARALLREAMESSPLSADDRQSASQLVEAWSARVRAAAGPDDGG